MAAAHQVDLENVPAHDPTCGLLGFNTGIFAGVIEAIDTIVSDQPTHRLHNLKAEYERVTGEDLRRHKSAVVHELSQKQRLARPVNEEKARDEKAARARKWEEIHSEVYDLLMDRIANFKVDG